MKGEEVMSDKKVQDMAEGMAAWSAVEGYQWCRNQRPEQRARWVIHMDTDITQGDGQTWSGKDCESNASFKLFLDLQVYTRCWWFTL